MFMLTYDYSYVIIRYVCLEYLLLCFLLASIDLYDDKIEDSQSRWLVFEGFLAHDVCSGLCIWGCEYFAWALLRDRESTYQVYIDFPFAACGHYKMILHF